MEAYALNNLWCYYTENHISTKIRGRNHGKDRSSRSQMFFKIDVVKNLRNLTAKYMCWSFFIYLRLQQRCFSVKFCKFLRTPFFTEHFRWLLLEGVCEGTSLKKILQSCHFNIFGINHRCFRKIPIKKNNK